MEIKYCLPIIADSISQCRARISEAQSLYQYFEVWLDYLNDPEDCLDLAQELGSRGIFLFRRMKLEEPRMSTVIRQALLSELATYDILIDFDLSSQSEDLAFFRSLPKRVATLICSYHNYSRTPELSELRELEQQMLKGQPSIFKFSCFCNSPRDAVRLLDFRLELNERRRKSIVLGMGEHGLVTRVFGTLWGNEMIFAPRHRSQQSAPEQLTRTELESVFRSLERKEN